MRRGTLRTNSATMKFHVVAIFIMCHFAVRVASAGNATDTSIVKAPRQLEYISLIGTLLQQTSMLSSMDGALLAATTVSSALLARARPMLVAGFFSYLMYAGMALVAPGTAARMGILPHRGARSTGGGMVAEALMRSIQFSPVMSVVTNVSVSVMSDAAGRLRSVSRILGHQMRWLQGRVGTWSESLQANCIEQFLCRVGRFTQDSFPVAAMALRAIGTNYPSLDSFAVAIVRGTSSSNCSIVYPDCTVF